MLCELSYSAVALEMGHFHKHGSLEKYAVSVLSANITFLHAFLRWYGRYSTWAYKWVSNYML